MTIDGADRRMSLMKRTVMASLLERLNSARKVPHNIPTGVPTAVATAVMTRLP